MLETYLLLNIGVKPGWKLDKKIFFKKKGLGLAIFH